MNKKFIVATILITSCLFFQAQAQVEIREVPAFTEISLRIAAKVHLIQGDKQKVEISASESTLKELITEVSGRSLVIRTRNRLNFSFNPGKVDIYITAPEITALNISGSGDIMAEGEWNTRIMDLSVSGSGSIYMDKLNAERVKAIISGSGDIVLKDGRKADDFNGNISGSGNIRANNYEASNVNVRIAGSGNCNIHTNGNLIVRIAGSGNVYYTGNPNLDTSIAGSGKVIGKN
jgi:hypothetical protein